MIDRLVRLVLHLVVARPRAGVRSRRHRGRLDPRRSRRRHAQGSDEREPLLAALAGDSLVEDSVSARAVEWLGRRIGLDHGRPILEAAVPAQRRPTAIAAARALGAVGAAEAEPALLAATALIARRPCFP